MQDISNYKYRLSDYLNYKNIEQKKGFYRCPNPNHADENISNCKLYTNPDGQVLTCFVCGDNWDVFDVSGMITGRDDFKDQLSDVMLTLGLLEDVAPVRQTVKKIDTSEYVQTPIEKLNEVYNDEKILRYAIEKGYGSTIQGKYLCLSHNGKLCNGIEYRFEDNDGKKCVFVIWYNGHVIKWTNPPRLIFGLNEVKEGLPYLIVEGPKTREIAAEHLPDFNVLTWNGGANNVDKVDWNGVIPEDATVYLWADDDQPGVSAMMKIEEVLR